MDMEKPVSHMKHGLGPTCLCGLGWGTHTFTLFWDGEIGGQFHINCEASNTRVSSHRFSKLVSARFDEDIV